MTSARRSISLTGACLGGLYGICSALCVAMALMAEDPKSRFVLLQLPIALQVSCLPEPLLRAMDEWSWPLTYLLCVPATVAAAYLFGAGVEDLARSK